MEEDFNVAILVFARFLRVISMIAVVLYFLKCLFKALQILPVGPLSLSSENLVSVTVFFTKYGRYSLFLL